MADFNPFDDDTPAAAPAASAALDDFYGEPVVEGNNDALNPFGDSGGIAIAAPTSQPAAVTSSANDAMFDPFADSAGMTNAPATIPTQSSGGGGDPTDELQFDATADMFGGGDEGIGGAMGGATNTYVQSQPPPMAAAAAAPAAAAPQQQQQAAALPSGRFEAMPGDYDDNGPSRFNIKFYRRYFNVDTADVGKRVMRSMWPIGTNFIPSMKPTADFYGPFWITTTLVFTIAAAGNFSGYLAADDQADYEYDFSKVTFGAIALYCYVMVLPLLLWVVMNYMSIELELVELLALFGYSMFIFCPISMMAIIPVDWVQWLLIGFGGAVSSCFVITALMKPLSAEKFWGPVFILVVAAFQLALVLTLKLYFFDFKS